MSSTLAAHAGNRDGLDPFATRISLLVVWPTRSLICVRPTSDSIVTLATGRVVCVASRRPLPIPCGFAVPVFLWQARISSNAGKIANRVSSSYLTSNHSASNRTATTGTIVRTQLGCITSRFLRPTVHRMPPARVNLVPRIVTADRWLRRCLSVLALSRSAF